MKLSDPKSIISYWFGDEYLIKDRKELLQSMDYINTRFPLWFLSSSNDFNNIQFNNAELIEYISSNDTLLDQDEHWSSPTGLLARILVLDQFPRVVYRGTSKAFETDYKAFQLSQRLVNNNLYFDYFFAIERLFILMPYTHLEDLSAQVIGLELGIRVAEGENNEILQFFRDMKGFPREHHDIIKRFGRFPSRNSALGRETTEEEETWLNSPECPYWAKSQMKKFTY